MAIQNIRARVRVCVSCLQNRMITSRVKLMFTHKISLSVLYCASKFFLHFSCRGLPANMLAHIECAWDTMFIRISNISQVWCWCYQCFRSTTADFLGSAAIHGKFRSIFTNIILRELNADMSVCVYLPKSYSISLMPYKNRHTHLLTHN